VISILVGSYNSKGYTGGVESVNYPLSTSMWVTTHFGQCPNTSSRYHVTSASCDHCSTHAIFLRVG